MDNEKVAKLKEGLINFFDTLHPYDFYGLYWLGAVLIFLLILIVILRDKVGVSASLMLVFMMLIFFAPPFLYIKIHKYLYGTEYQIEYIKQMKFANVLVIKGKLISNGEANITNCKLHTFVMPPQDGFMKDFQILYAIKPLKKDTFDIDKPLENGETTEFKLKFTQFTYSKDINNSDIYIYRECFNNKL